MPYNTNLSRGAIPTYSATPGTHPLIPEDVAHEIIKAATQKSVVLQLFKHRKMSTQEQRMPVLASKPTAFFISGDTGLKQTTTLTWTNKFLDAEELAVIVPIPEKLLDDVDYDLWAEIKPELEEAIAVALDAAVLFGTNKPASWPSSIFTAAVAAANTVTQGAGVDIAADVNSVMGSVEADGFEVNGFVMRNSLKATFRGLRATTNEFIFLPGEPGVNNTTYKAQLFGEKVIIPMSGVFEDHDVATANACELIAGDFSQGLIGIRQDLSFKMLDQAVLQDATGAIQYNLPQQDMVAMRVVARFAFQVPNPTNRMQSVEANRYPFGVLRMTA